MVALSSPLLKDSSMKAVVMQSKEIISTAEERCQEAEVRCRMNSSFIEDFVWIGHCDCLWLHKFISQQFWFNSRTRSGRVMTFTPLPSNLTVIYSVGVLLCSKYVLQVKIIFSLFYF